jgi:NADH-quinone oxidoreductase subunit J
VGPENVAFAVIAAAMVFSAIRVVTTRNIVHAALYLVIVLAGIAAQYILLAAEFVAWVQVLIYIGAVLVLFLFGIMLTKAPMRGDNELDNDQRWPAGIASLFLAGVLGTILVDGYGDVEIAEPDKIVRAGDLGRSIFHDWVIPFEVVSLLLLGALIGAIVIARRDT